MKVLHFFKVYLPDSFGGVERVIWELAEGLAPYGVESHVLALSPSPSDNPMRIGSHVVHQAKQNLYVASTGLSFSVFKRFRSLVRDVDIVHYHFPWPMMDIVHQVVRPTCPIIVTYHSDVVKQRLLYRFYKPLMHRFLQDVDRIVATSPAYARTSRVLASYQNTLSIIPIGIRDRDGQDIQHKQRWREKVGTDFFLFVGALRYYKGIPQLLKAAEITGLPVVIVGKGELEREISSKRLPNVRLYTDVDDDDKEALLSLCRAFVFPSHLRSEAFGVALLEAARAGRPMISCEIGTGTSFVNVDGETGYVIAPDSPAQLASAMKRLATDRQEALRMGRKARVRYERLFRSEIMVESYFNLYREIAQRRDQ